MKALIRGPAAASFVAHSFATGAPAHDPDVGAMMRSIEAAVVPACRGKRCENDGAGIAEADTVAPRKVRHNVVNNIVCDY